MVMFSITGYWESLQSHVELVTGGGSICLQAIFRAIGSFLAFARAYEASKKLTLAFARLLMLAMTLLAL